MLWPYVHPVGEKPTVILHTYNINRHAGSPLIPNKTRTKGTISLDYNSICNIGSRIGWVLKEIYYNSLGCRMVHTYKLVVVVVLFTLTDRASTISSNIRGCQFGTLYGVEIK